MYEKINKNQHSSQKIKYLSFSYLIKKIIYIYINISFNSKIYLSLSFSIECHKQDNTKVRKKRSTRRKARIPVRTNKRRRVGERWWGWRSGHQTQRQNLMSQSCCGHWNRSNQLCDSDLISSHSPTLPVSTASPTLSLLSSSSTLVFPSFLP